MKKNGELSLDELVAIRVKEELKNYAPNYRPVSKEWIELRKEIDIFVRETMTKKSKYSYSTCQTFMYNTIKSITGCSRIDSLNGENIKKAKRVFNFYRTEFEEVD